MFLLFRIESSLTYFCTPMVLTLEMQNVTDKQATTG